MDTIGSKITKARIKLNINQKELCQKTGIKESTLSRYENNQAEPRYSTIMTLAKALNVSYDYLMGASETMDLPNNPPHDNSDKNLENFLSNSENYLSQEGLIFNGKPVSKEDANKLITAMKVGVGVMDVNI